MHLVVKSILGSLLLPFSAYGSDFGTYRAGNPYMSIPAQSPDQCISQCQGDAQCKGWNFVRVSPEQTICEFNARQVAPIASAISISGNSQSAIDDYGFTSGRLIMGGQRTTRIGQPQLASNYQPKPTTRGRNYPTASRPAHKRMVHHPARTVPPQAPAQPSRPNFMPMLDTVPQSRAVSQNRPLVQRPRPSFKPMLDNTRIPQTSSVSPTRRSAVQTEKVPPRIPSLPEKPINRPHIPIEPSLVGGPATVPAPKTNSLYGTLYDDVKAPKSLDNVEIPLDPEAPIPTVTSVPIGKLEVSPF